MGALYLVRHGQAPAHAYGVGEPDQNDSGLTDLGVTQSRRTGELLARFVPRFDAAFSGELPRQRATAQGVLSAFDDAIEHRIDADWDEYSLPQGVTTVDADVYADRAKYQSVLDDALNAWVAGAPAPGGETYDDFAARTRAAADRAAALAGTGRNVLVVSSAGTITQLVAQLWNVPREGWPTLSRTFVNASVSKIVVGRRGLTVVSVNEHAHLAADEVVTYR